MAVSEGFARWRSQLRALNLGSQVDSLVPGVCMGLSSLALAAEIVYSAKRALGSLNLRSQGGLAAGCGGWFLRLLSLVLSVGITKSAKPNGLVGSVRGPSLAGARSRDH